MNELKRVRLPLGGAPVYTAVWLHHGEILALEDEGEMVVLGILREIMPVPKAPRARKEKPLTVTTTLENS